MRDRKQQTHADIEWLGYERILLASAIVNPHWIADLLPKVAVRDFRDADHGRAWAMIRDWWETLPAEERATVGEATGPEPLVYVRLHAAEDSALADRLDRLLPDYLARYSSGQRAVVEHAAERVALFAAQERYRAEVDRLQRQLQQEKDPETRAVIANAIAGVPLPAGDAKTKKTGEWASDVFSAVLDGTATSPWVCETGLAAFDRRNGGGLHPKRLYVVAGRPGWGKTVLLTQIAANACRAGYGVAFASLEMGEEDLLLRMAAYIGDVYLMDRDQTRYPISRAERARIEAARDEIAGWPLHLRCRPTTAQQLVGWASDLQQRQDVRIVLVDYIGIVAGANQRQTERERIADASRICKELAMQGLAVVAAAQLNREAEVPARPGAAHLYGADQIAMDADCVVIPWRPKQAGQYPEGYAELLTVKGRRTKPGRDRVQWVGRTQSYLDATDLWLEVIDGDNGSPVLSLPFGSNGAQDE